jgi:CubicO group peptidase (beta-lactamase class C family)
MFRDADGRVSMTGFSKSRLERVRSVLDGHGQRGATPGAVAVLARGGETLVEAAGDVRADSIFRIASMTKPIAAVAALVLVEECVLRLDDPVDEYLPELADRRVLTRLDVSTADDYAAFAAMLRGGGVYRGVRILSRAAVSLMTSDQLPTAVKAVSGLAPGDFDDQGWGFGVSVVTRRTQLYHSVGTYGWTGGLGTSWFSDPAEDLTLILLTQQAFTSHRPPAINQDFWTAAYQALDE